MKTVLGFSVCHGKQRHTEPPRSRLRLGSASPRGPPSPRRPQTGCLAEGSWRGGVPGESGVSRLGDDDSFPVGGEETRFRLNEAWRTVGLTAGLRGATRPRTALAAWDLVCPAPRSALRPHCLLLSVAKAVPRWGRPFVTPPWRLSTPRELAQAAGPQASPLPGPSFPGRPGGRALRVLCLGVTATWDMRVFSHRGPACVRTSC